MTGFTEGMSTKVVYNKKEESVLKDTVITFTMGAKPQLKRVCAKKSTTFWSLQYAELHQPSEHMVLGKSYDAELQFYFSPNDKKIENRGAINSSWKVVSS